MVNKRPFTRSLQHIVEVILQASVPGVPATALCAVGQRFPQKTEPGSLLPLRSRRTCRSGRQETVPDARRVVHLPVPGLHIFQCVILRPACRGALYPEPGVPCVGCVGCVASTSAAAADLVAGVTSRHGITSAGVECAGRTAGIRTCNRVLSAPEVCGVESTLVVTGPNGRSRWVWKRYWVLFMSPHRLMVFSLLWPLRPSALGWTRGWLRRRGSIYRHSAGGGRAHPPTTSTSLTPPFLSSFLPSNRECRDWTPNHWTRSVGGLRWLHVTVVLKPRGAKWRRSYAAREPAIWPKQAEYLLVYDWLRARQVEMNNSNNVNIRFLFLFY